MRLVTKDLKSFRYGLIRARIKLPVGFHVYSACWEPGRIRGGRLSQPPGRSTAFPQAILIDYIRIYPT